MPPSRREELVETAMRVFCRHGFHASGVERVLEEGNFSRMTLYNHFRSKEELIVAAMRRRDEIFRNRMMRFVETEAETPRERLLMVFAFHERWFGERDFRGCMFINAAAEFEDPHFAPRRVAAEHKIAIVRYLRELCVRSGFARPDQVAEQLNILIEGAIVAAQVVGQVQDGGADPGASARLARDMARAMLDSAECSGSSSK